MARYQVRARLLRRRAIARLGERPWLWVDLHRTGASKVMYANPPDLPEMLVWREVLRDGDLFVDVGANVGPYTIWAAELGAEVIALEPVAALGGDQDRFDRGLRREVSRHGHPGRARLSVQRAGDFDV